MPPQTNNSHQVDNLSIQWSKKHFNEVRELYLLRSSWIRDMSKPLLPRKYFDPNGSAGAG